MAIAGSRQPDFGSNSFDQRDRSSCRGIAIREAFWLVTNGRICSGVARKLAAIQFFLGPPDDAPINRAKRAAISVITFIDDFVPPRIDLADVRRVRAPEVACILRRGRSDADGAAAAACPAHRDGHRPIFDQLWRQSPVRH